MTSVISRFIFGSQDAPKPPEKSPGPFSKGAGIVGNIASAAFSLFKKDTNRPQQHLSSHTIRKIKAEQIKAKDKEEALAKKLEEDKRVQAEKRANRQAQQAKRRNRGKGGKKASNPNQAQSAVAIVNPNPANSQNPKNGSYLNTAAKVAAGAAFLFGAAYLGYLALPYFVATGTSSTLLALPAPTVSTALTVVSNTAGTVVATGGGSGMIAAQAALGSLFTAAAAMHTNANFTVNFNALQNASLRTGIPQRDFLDAAANYYQINLHEDFYEYLPSEDVTALSSTQPHTLDLETFQEIAGEIIQIDQTPPPTRVVEVIQPNVEPLRIDQPLEQPSLDTGTSDLAPAHASNETQLIRPNFQQFQSPQDLVCPSLESESELSLNNGVCNPFLTQTSNGTQLIRPNFQQFQSPQDLVCPSLESDARDLTNLTQSNRTQPLVLHTPNPSVFESQSQESFWSIPSLVTGAGLTGLVGGALANLLSGHQSSENPEITIQGEEGWSYKIKIKIRDGQDRFYSEEDIQIIANSIVKGILNTLVKNRSDIVKHGEPFEIKFPENGGFTLHTLPKEQDKSQTHASQIPPPSHQSEQPKVIYKFEDGDSVYAPYKDVVSKIRTVLVHPEQINSDQRKSNFTDLKTLYYNTPSKKHKKTIARTGPIPLTEEDSDE